MNTEKIIEKITSAGQLATLLEISGYPKPGNVHRIRDFPETKYEHFLAGSVAIRTPLTNSTEKGIAAGQGKIPISKIEIGKKIEQGINLIENIHRGGNTHLGVLLLFVPLSAAAGKTFVENEELDNRKIRKNFEQIMKSTTTQDGVHTCKAIKTAMDIDSTEKNAPKTSWLGKVKKLDLKLSDEDLETKLEQGDISLYDLMETSSQWDGIARELTNRMKVSFETGYPTLKKVYDEIEDINVAIVQTFLKILSKHPDTFIARKVGLEQTNDIAKAVKIGMKKSREVSSRADKILQAGGLKTKKGKKELEKLDEELHKENGKLNPGTTADLTASSTMVALLNGLKY